MTTTPITEVKALRDELAAESKEIHAEFTEFPSGSAMLDVHRSGHLFVLAYSPSQGFGVDEVHADDGFIDSYQFVYQQFEPAAEKLRALSALPGAAKAGPTLSLVVLESSNVEATKDFYSAVGLSFVEEQHGKGPAHYAATLGPLVLEIYPCRRNTIPAPMRLGFRVAALDQTIETLRNRGARIIREAKDSPWGRRAVVEDPDGNRVELALAS